MDQTPVGMGVANMLRNCGGAAPGQRLLIAYEPPEYGFFAASVVTKVAETASELGLDVDQIDVGFEAACPRFSDDLKERMARADLVVFLARLGDQLRFSDMPDGPTIINSYTLNETLLRSAFSWAHYGAFQALKAAVDRLIAGADEVRMSCRNGTIVQGRLARRDGLATDTSLRRFPLSVFSPVRAAGLSGRVALAGFLTGTGSRYYDDYTVEFEAQTHAVIENGRLVTFEGSDRDVALARAQYDRVSTLFGIDRDAVHSWHAGIHPGCGYPWGASENYETWGGTAFGNPRVLHFHTCGDFAPGEISWNVIDPTIEIDGTAYWQDGVFRAELLPEGPDILSRYPCAAYTFQNPDRAVGLSDP